MRLPPLQLQRLLKAAFDNLLTKIITNKALKNQDISFTYLPLGHIGGIPTHFK